MCITVICWVVLSPLSVGYRKPNAMLSMQNTQHRNSLSKTFAALTAMNPWDGFFFTQDGFLRCGRKIQAIKRMKLLWICTRNATLIIHGSLQPFATYEHKIPSCTTHHSQSIYDTHPAKYSKLIWEFHDLVTWCYTFTQYNSMYTVLLPW